MTIQQKLPRLATALLLAGAAACAKSGDNAADTAAPSIGATDTSRGALARTDSAMTDSTSGARNGWTVPSILGYTTVANRAEIDEGQLAAKKGTNPAVKAYGREIAADHEAMLKEGQSLASKLSATADTTNGDAHDLLNDAHGELKDLTDKPAGADWDEDFIEHEIDGHQAVLGKLQDAAQNTNDADLRAALEKATGKVQQHLTKAQDIKANKLHH